MIIEYRTFTNITVVIETSKICFQKESFSEGEGWKIWCETTKDNEVVFCDYKEEFEKVKQIIEDKLKAGETFIDFTEIIDC